MRTSSVSRQIILVVFLIVIGGGTLSMLFYLMYARWSWIPLIVVSVGVGSWIIAREITGYVLRNPRRERERVFLLALYAVAITILMSICLSLP